MLPESDGINRRAITRVAGILLLYEYAILALVLTILFAVGQFWNAHENAIGITIVSADLSGMLASVLALWAMQGKRATLALLGFIPLLVFVTVTFIPL